MLYFAIKLIIELEQILIKLGRFIFVFVKQIQKQKAYITRLAKLETHNKLLDISSPKYFYQHYIFTINNEQNLNYNKTLKSN